MVPTQQVDLLVAVADGVLDAVNQKEDPGTDVRDDRRVEPRKIEGITTVVRVTINAGDRISVQGQEVQLEPFSFAEQHGDLAVEP